METVKVNNWIGRGARELFEEEKTLTEMVQDMKESTKQYHVENKLFYTDINKKIAEIQSTLGVVVDEQEKQRIANMTMRELFCEMMKNIDCMKEKIDRIADE